MPSRRHAITRLEAFGQTDRLELANARLKGPSFEAKCLGEVGRRPAGMRRDESQGRPRPGHGAIEPVEARDECRYILPTETSIFPERDTRIGRGQANRDATDLANRGVELVLT